MTEEDLLKKTGHSLKMKDLRAFVKSNQDLSDNAPCVIERVEDKYFEGLEWNDGRKTSGWDVLKVEGYQYHSSLEWNEKMKREIELRKVGEGEYDEDLDPSKAILGEKELEATKEQFYQPHCILTDKGIIYIYSHY